MCGSSVWSPAMVDWGTGADGLETQHLCLTLKVAVFAEMEVGAYSA